MPLVVDTKSNKELQSLAISIGVAIWRLKTGSDSSPFAQHERTSSLRVKISNFIPVENNRDDFSYRNGRRYLIRVIIIT
jgi:hypothetical protein